MADDDAPILQVRGVTKSFPGVRALHQVDLTLRRGQVLAVIGENGAGKSTLMKILAGIQPPDAGEIRMDGRPIDFANVNAAMDAGIVLIHQELNLCGNLNAAENIFLGREPRRFGLIDRKAMERGAAEAMQRVGLDLSPRSNLDTLAVGHQQMIEIAKALSVNARVLIMDEPTSSLSQHESAQLFRVVKDLRARGVSIIYISHRLSEVRDLADRVAVLRDGENAGQLDRADVTHDRMVSMMVGRDISQYYARKSHEPGEVALEVRDLRTIEHPRHRVSFQVHAGEIVGLAGLVGAGRTELLRAIFGVDTALGGEVHVHGRPVRFRSPIDAIRAGLALVPEDRKQQGLIVEMAVRHNVGLPGLRRHARAGALINRRQEAADADEMIRRLNIKTPSAHQVARFLSGGNQQKVVLGKWLALRPRVLLLDEPTRGVDVGAKQEIYRVMETLAGEGVAILFVSSEMEEVLGMADRALVMHEGRLTGQLPRQALSEEAVMQFATGVAHGDEPAAAPAPPTEPAASAHP